MSRLVLFSVLFAVSPAMAALVEKPVTWSHKDSKFKGVLVWDDAVKAPRPGLLLVPNWMGVTPANVRQARELAGVVSFHGGLDTPRPEDAQHIRGRVLALHGADDPFVPSADVSAFEAELRAAKVDWQLVAFGGAVHSFTDVDAKQPGKAQYHPQVARRAYALMHAFFDELFAP